MPEISLKDYFAKLNSLMSSNAADEVIHHSRHILQYYPKNVTAYRFLGRALVNNGRWEEGREALRRVLGVIPDDYTAHLGLSEANERMNRPDEGIWHLERAFEQRPNDKELIDALRGLYRRHRQIENVKIQLTATAVARQYMRSGAYGQAIDTLRSALARMKDRIDLKVMLAQILWQQGSQEEAADIALDVLNVLPDCLEANRIMAQLWLEVERPSDARRYVNRLESLDPYMAVEIVQGSAADDDAFRVEELDYERSAQSEVASARPDWLQEISAGSAPAEAEQGEEWSNWASAMLGGSAASETADAPAEQPMPGDSAPPNTSGFTGVFGSADDIEPEEAQQLSALFEQSTDEADPMAWLRDSGVQIVEEEEEPSYDNLFGLEEDGPLPEPDENPMAWMQSSGDDLLLDTEKPVPQEEDPFSWMNDSSSEFSNEEAQPSTADSLDWLQGDPLLDEALDAEELGEALSEELTTRQTQRWKTDAFRPATPTVEGESEMNNQSEALPVEEQGVPGPRRGLTAMLQEATFDWTQKQEEEIVSDDEMDEWLRQFGPSEPRQAESETPEWLTNLEQSDEATDNEENWLADFQSDAAAPTGEFTVEQASIAMSSDQPPEKDDDSADWLAEFAPEEKADDEDFAWMSDEALTESAEEAAVAEDAPDWLAALEPQQTSEPAGQDQLFSEPEAAVVEETPDWLSALEPQTETSAPEPTPVAAEEDFAWMSDEALTEPAEEAAVVEETPDWLSALEPQLETSEPQPASETSVAAEEDFTWMSDEALIEPAEAAAVAGDMPDWLSELEPEPETNEPQPASETPPEEDFAWMSDEALPEPTEEAAAIMGEAPDWLSELEPQSETSAPEPTPVAAEEDFAWMSDEALTEPAEEVAAVAEAAPDWLLELEPKPETSEPQPTEETPVAAEEDFAWMSDEALTEPAEEVAAVAEAAPDWLSELEPQQEISAAEEPAEQTTEDQEFGWLNQPEAETVEEELAVVGEVPDWLSELEPEEEPAPSEAITAEPTTADDDFGWLDEPVVEAEDEPVAVDEGVPEWLDEEEPEFAEEESGATLFDETEEIEDNEEEAAVEEEFLEPTPATNAPDWLNAMVPGLDVDYEAAEDLIEEETEAPAGDGAKREFTWLVELVEEETNATEQPSFAFSRPPAWAAPMNSAADGGVDDDLPDWPADDTDADVADWLR